MAELFSTSRTNIIEHINNIYSEQELDKNSTCQNFRQGKNNKVEIMTDYEIRDLLDLKEIFDGSNEVWINKLWNI